jgi:hypothetical protein
MENCPKQKTTNSGQDTRKGLLMDKIKNHIEIKRINSE